MGEIDFQKGADRGDLNRRGGPTILDLTLCNAFHHFVIITIIPKKPLQNQHLVIMKNVPNTYLSTFTAYIETDGQQNLLQKQGCLIVTSFHSSGFHTERMVGYGVSSKLRWFSAAARSHSNSLSSHTQLSSFNTHSCLNAVSYNRSSLPYHALGPPIPCFNFFIPTHSSRGFPRRVKINLSCTQLSPFMPSSKS